LPLIMLWDTDAGFCPNDRCFTIPERTASHGHGATRRVSIAASQGVRYPGLLPLATASICQAKPLHLGLRVPVDGAVVLPQQQVIQARDSPPAWGSNGHAL